MKSKYSVLIGLAVVLVLGYVFIYQGLWVWVVENTDVPPDKMLILVAKTGKGNAAWADHCRLRRKRCDAGNRSARTSFHQPALL